MRLELPTPPPKKVVMLRFSKSVSNKLNITLQPHKLYLQTWCTLKVETVAFYCVKIMNLGIGMLEVGLFVSGTSGVADGGSGLYKVYGVHCVTLVNC